MKFKVTYSDKPKSVDIVAYENNHSHPDAFIYSNMCSCYTTCHGHGLQSNKPENDKALIKMCDKIAQVIYDYQEEIQ